jgi:hypothetical protein
MAVRVHKKRGAPLNGLRCPRDAKAYFLPPARLSPAPQMPLAKAVKEWVRHGPRHGRWHAPGVLGQVNRRTLVVLIPPPPPDFYSPFPFPAPQETRNSKVAADEKAVMLYGGFIFGDKRQFINKLDGTLATLRNCERLALSTNQIDRMTPFTGMENLRLLSLSRNAIKKIERLEDVANTLEELWISYNLISSLDGLGACQKLQVRGGERERAEEETAADDDDVLCCSPHTARARSLSPLLGPPPLHRLSS